MSHTTVEVDTHWRARRADAFVWAQLGDDYVAYHRPSGKTHFLNRATADLLTHVLATPRTARSAAEALAEREGAAIESEFFSAVAESLLLLEHLGLIERCER